jgi:hypothetical protein
MTTEKAIFDFITQPDNLPFALTLADCVEDLKKEMHIGFWRKFNKALENRLIDENASNMWKYKPFPRRYRKDWEKSYIVPHALEEITSALLAFAFGQNTLESGYKLMWGVYWTVSPKHGFDHPALTTIKSILVSHDIQFSEAPKWIRWGDYPLSLLDADFLARMNNEPEILVGKVVDDVWQLFSELRPYMEEVNLAVQPI